MYAPHGYAALGRHPGEGLLDFAKRCRDVADDEAAARRPYLPPAVSEWVAAWELRWALDAFEAGPTLTEALAAAGFTHEPATGRGVGPYGRNVLDAAGRVVFTGDAHQTWAWLRERIAEREAA